MKYLFVCIENSCRSQMAEAFARMGGADARSAGSHPSGRVNPKAIAAMRALGYDLGSHTSKSIADLGSRPFDVLVTMGCGDPCSNAAAERRVEWDVPDPANLDEAAFREVRDLIGRKVEELLET